MVLDTPCIEWTGSRDASGYGRFFADGKEYKIHRFVCELFYGPLGHLQARHRCDNPPCYAWDHVIPGTPQDNTRDAVQRCRTHVYPFDGGSKHARLFLDAEACRRSLGIGHARFAQQVGINQASWSMCRRGKWQPSQQTITRLEDYVKLAQLRDMVN